MKKIFLYLFLISFISTLLLIFPSKEVKSSSEKEIAEKEYKIQLPKREVNLIIGTLNQKITNKSIDLIVSSLEPEKEAILSLINASVKISSFNYILTQAPKEIIIDFINTGTKIAPVFFDFSLSTFWKMGINDAKNYAIKWLLENELRTGGGNLPLSYKTYTGEIENVNFSFILVYNPTNNKIEINIYSSKEIKTQGVTVKHMWTGGIEKISPFIVNISGEIKKNEYEAYVWVNDPKIDINFPENVPDFKFEEQTFIERQIESIKEKIIALQRAEEKIKVLLKEIEEMAKITGKGFIENTKGIGFAIINSIKGFFGSINSIFSKTNLFQASIYQEIYTENPSPDFLMRQKAKEILEEIKRMDIPLDYNFLEEEILKEETNLDDLWKKLLEMERMIEEIKKGMSTSTDNENIENIEEGEEVEICRVDLNSALIEDLQKITGIGPTYAERIINTRPFSSIDDLIRVSGIGSATILKIKEQGCAYIDSDYYIPIYSGGGSSGGSKNDNFPIISLQYNEDNPVNREIIVNVSLSNLESKNYDLKLSIEKEGTILSNTYNQVDDQWKSSNYYINNLFSGNSFDGNISLQIREENNDFRGNAEIIIKIRNNDKIIAEKKEFINIIEEDEEEDEESEENNNEGEEYETSFWPNFQQNSLRTGQSSVLGPASLNNPMVDIFLEGSNKDDYFYSPVIDSFNNLYFKAKIEGEGGIYSFDNQGVKRWFYESNINMVGDPIITEKGNIFFYNHIERYQKVSLIMLDKEGNLIWEKLIEDFYPVGYMGNHNNSINLILKYSSINNGKLISLDETTGEINWEYELSELSSTPKISVDKEGNSYFGIRNVLYKVGIDGVEIWKKNFEGEYYNTPPKTPIVGSITIKENNLYMIVYDMENRSNWDSPKHCIFSVDKENLGEENWRVCSRDFKFEDIVVSLNNNIYFGAGYYNGIRWKAGIYTITDSDQNTAKWLIKDLWENVEIPIIDSEENIYGIFGNSLLRAYDKEGNLKWQYSLSPSYRIKQLSMDGEGNLYVSGPSNIYIIRNKEEEKRDGISPSVYFNLDSIQKTIPFLITWSGEDFAEEGTTPSGIYGYRLEYSEDNESWLLILPEEGEEDDYLNKEDYSFLGEEGKDYYFRIKAKDKENNESDWVYASTTVSLERDIMIVEIQIEGEDIDNDFIKIYNPNDFEVDVSGYKLRKRNSEGTESSIKIFSSESVVSGEEYFIWANSNNSYNIEIEANSSSTATIAKNNSIALFNNNDLILSAVAWGESTNPFVEGTSFTNNPEKNEILKRIWIEGTEEYSNIKDNSLDFEIIIPN